MFRSSPKSTKGGDLLILQDFHFVQATSLPLKLSVTKVVKADVAGDVAVVAGRNPGPRLYQ